MYKIKTEKATYQVHQDVSEITFSQFCDFIGIDEQMHKGEETDSEALLVDAVRVFVPNMDSLPLALDEAYKTGYVPDLFKAISIYDLYLHYLGLLNTWFDSIVMPALESMQHLDQHQEKVTDLIGSASTIYEKSKAVMYYTEYISGCKVVGDDFTFHYKGHWYYVNSKRSASFFGLGKSYLAGEVVEVKEFRRRMSNAVDDSTELDSNIFKLGLHDVSILALREGEVIPYDIEKREAFINKRMLYFQDLPMDVVYEVGFFLINILRPAIIRTITKDSGQVTTAGRTG